MAERWSACLWIVDSSLRVWEVAEENNIIKYFYIILLYYFKIIYYIILKLYCKIIL